MTARYLITLSLVLGVGGFAGCAGDTTGTKDTPIGDDDDTAGDDDDDDIVGGTGTPPTDDTATGGNSNYIEWNTLTFAFQMGYDQQNRTPASVFIDLGTGPIEIPPDITLNLGDVAWSGDLQQTNLYCTIFIPLDNATFDQTFVGSDPRLLTAFIHNQADGVTTDCFDGIPGDLDPLYGTDFATYLQTYSDWGVAIGETEAYTASVISPYLTATLQPTDLVGGTIRMGAFFDPADVPEVFGWAWVVDQGLNVDIDANGYLSANPYAAVDLGNNVLQAWYDIGGLYIYSFY